MTLQELREKRAALVKEARALRDTWTGENRQPTDDELAAFNKGMDEADAVRTEIEQIEQRDQLEARLAAAETGLATIPERRAKPAKETTATGKPKVRLKIVGRTKHFPDNETAYRAGKWIMAALIGDERAAQWCRNNGVELRAHQESVNTTGGFLVPEEFNATIIDLREQYGVFRQHTKVQPMGRDTMPLGRRTGGLTAYAVGESTAPTESTKSWDQITLTARKWGVLTRLSTELAEDAIISVADDLASEIAYAFSNKEDDCGFLGDGTSTYHGIFGVFPKIDDTNHTASLFTAATGNTAFSTLDLADFEKTVGVLPQYPGIQAKWFISKPGYYSSMSRLMDAAGGNTKDDVAGGTGLQFLGYPVVISQVCNSTLSAQTDTVICVFGDLAMASTLGDRRGVTIATSEHYLFNTDEIMIRGMTRYDINVHDLGDTTNAGPLIGLKTPAS